MDLRWAAFWLPLILAQIAAGNWWNSSASNLHVGQPVRTVGVDGNHLTKGGHVGSWLLRILKGNVFVCGASYISELYAVTSANCMHPYHSDLSSLTVEFFTPDPQLDDDPEEDDQEPSYALVVYVYVPQEWRWRDTYMDVAIVKLNNRLRGNLNDFVRLCSKPLSAHASLEVVACSAAPLEAARAESLTVLDRMNCEEVYGNFILRETVTCAKEFTRTTNCMFEPGCPVTANEELCGVVAWGPPTCKRKLPGIFTDLYQARHFIKKVIGGNKRSRTHKRNQNQQEFGWPQWRSGFG